MLGVTLFGIFLTPVFFYEIEGLAGFIRARRERRIGGGGEKAAPAEVKSNRDSR
jgi:hypothetical protein